jgi:hypothetical protein
VPARRRSTPQEPGAPRSPARTPQERENQLIDAAVDLAHRQIQDGTASSMVIAHYLKLGSSRERLEQTRLQHEIELAKTKREQMISEMQMGELIQEALAAMRKYTGQAPAIEDAEYDEYPG